MKEWKKWKEPVSKRLGHMHEKMKFFIKDFFSKCDQIRTKLRRKLWIWSHAEEILSAKLYFLSFAYCLW